MDLIPAPEGTTLIFVRHGETVFNRDNRFQGQADVPLSPVGVRQAELLRARMPQLGPDIVISSDLERAWRTAEIALDGRWGFQRDARLKEVGFGEWEGLTLDEARRRDPQLVEDWMACPSAVRPPGAESLEEMQARCLRSVIELTQAHPGRRVLIVGHGGPIRVLICRLIGAPLPVARQFVAANTSVSIVAYSARGPRLIRYNDTEHLQPMFEPRR